MVSFKSTAISAAALLALVQYTPAPFALIPVVISIDLGTAAAWVGAAGGIIGGSAAAASAANSAKHGKRDLDSVETVVPVADEAVVSSRVKRIAVPFDPALGTEIEWRNCHNELKKASIGVRKAATGSLVIDSVPGSCIAVSNKVHGRVGEGNPSSNGGSIQFDNLSDGKLQEVVDALHARRD